MNLRADELLVKKGIVRSRSQAADFIKRGAVSIDGNNIKKPGQKVPPTGKVTIGIEERYVSRAGEKLASVAESFGLDFKGAVILDVGSSTGGFTDYALQHGAQKSIAVEVGTDQLHPSLQGNPKIELHEQTDIRDLKQLSARPNIVVIDVSFISLREILPHVAKLSTRDTKIVAMVKPQFEAPSTLKHKGVIKNERLRRDILKDFEVWAKGHFVIQQKADSKVAGGKGNLERFYLLQVL